MKEQYPQVDELDFREENKRFFEIQCAYLKKRFEQKNLPCHLFTESKEIYSFISQFVKDRPWIKNIAFSDGVTLYQLNLFDWVRQNFTAEEGFTINQPLERGKTGQFAVYGDQPPGRMHIPYDEWKVLNDKWYQSMRDSLMSDLLIVSANAITMNGEIVSVDGMGNRVAGMIFGPRHVLVVVGKNKIVKDLDAAVERIHSYTVPLTYLRHNMKHWCNFQEVPCVKFGKCANCSHPESACRNKVVVNGQVKQHSDRIHLLVINQDLGF